MVHKEWFNNNLGQEEMDMEKGVYETLKGIALSGMAAFLVLLNPLMAGSDAAKDAKVDIRVSISLGQVQDEFPQLSRAYF